MKFSRLLVNTALVLVIVAIVGVAAYALSERQPTRYSATTIVRFDTSARPELQVLGGGFAYIPSDEDRLAATNLGSVRSFNLAVATARADPDLGLTPEQVASDISVSSQGASNLIDITAIASTRERAVRLANTYRAQVRTDHRNRDGARVRQAQDAITQELAELTVAQRRGLRGETLPAQLGALGVLRRIGTGTPEIIQSARASSGPATPKTQRNVLFGILFGLLLAIGLVALRGGAGFADREHRLLTSDK